MENEFLDIYDLFDDLDIMPEDEDEEEEDLDEEEM